MADLEAVITNAVHEAYPDSGVEAAPEAPVEAPEAPTEPEVEAEGATPSEEPEAAPEAPKEATEAVEEEKPKNPNQRIPLHRHESILANARKKAAEEVASVQAKYAQYETPEMQQAFRAIRLAETDPKAFLGILAQNEAYRELLQPKPVSTPEPEGDIEPDVDLGNGARGYSLTAVKKMLDQRAAAVEARIAQRFEPFTKEAEQRAVLAQATAAVEAKIAEAKTWEGFTENETAIAEALKADESLTLEAAYRKVVVPKLVQSRDEIRKQVIAELNAKPKAVGIMPRAAKPVAPAGARDIEEVITEALREKGLL